MRMYGVLPAQEIGSIVEGGIKDNKFSATHDGSRVW